MISDKIKELREQSGLSQSALAKKLGVTRSSVNAWEMGLSIPTTFYVVELAELFHVTTDFILGKSANETLVLDKLGEKEKKIIYDLFDYFTDKT